MRLCSYIVKHDIGLAPNPFWGYCTLAVCTPNHMGIKMQKGDWIVGFSSKSRGNKLVFAMQVKETQNFKEYFQDARFQQKKPKTAGDWKERCGDNFYESINEGKWIQHDNPFHKGEENCKKDTKYPYVFISDHFYYFGENSIVIPPEYRDLILDRQGCKYTFDTSLVEGFLAWLEQNRQPGVYENPQQREVDSEKDC